jgi:hypothetical protein
MMKNRELGVPTWHSWQKIIFIKQSMFHASKENYLQVNVVKAKYVKMSQN